MADVRGWSGLLSHAESRPTSPRKSIVPTSDGLFSQDESHAVGPKSDRGTLATSSSRA